MAFFGWVGRQLVPIVLEHTLPAVRDWWKGRSGTPRAKTDPLQQLAGEVEQLKAHAAQVDSSLDGLNANLENLNQAVTAREEKMRKWLLLLLILNIALTAGLLLLTVFILRH
ncbi:MAG TPA: hypothetical protein VI685_13840 [Candidatus Angelobacter sp.]